MNAVRLALPESHVDFQVARQIEKAVLESAKGFESFAVKFPRLLRQAIDEVIDSARSGRFTLDELEKTEKTYLGTKIEILLRNYLGFELGKKMDLLIDGIEVDVKNTIKQSWTIPREAFGHPCILISEIESTAKCSFGIIVIREELMNKGKNRDGKTTITAASIRDDVHWLLRDHPYPENFWQTLSPETSRKIFAPKGGAERIAALFRLNQERPISRGLVQALAQQKDYMKRVRGNGGARDILAPEGIALLSGAYDKELIGRLKLSVCGRDELISFAPQSKSDVDLLRNAGKIGR